MLKARTFKDSLQLARILRIKQEIKMTIKEKIMDSYSLLQKVKVLKQVSNQLLSIKRTQL